MAEKKEMVMAVKNELSDFSLSAEIVAGKLTSNAKELADKIKSELSKYSVERYLDNPDAAKTDKAFLTKVKDSVATKRKEISSLWNEPLNSFLDEMKDLEKSISSAYDELNNLVKKSDDSIKEQKKKEIEAYWNSFENKYVTLEKVFNPKWLNKTYSIKDIQKDISEKVENINKDLNTLKSMTEDSEILMAFYLETLDLNATLVKGNELKANRNKIKAAEIPVQVEIIKNNFNGVIVENPSKNDEKQQKNEEISVKTDENLQKNSQKPAEMTFTLRLTASVDKLVALRKYIDSNGIKYEKV